MLRRLGDRGEGSLSHLTVILLVAAVTAVVSVVAVGDKISAGIRSGVCVVSQDEDCREPGSGPGASPSPGASGASPTVVPAGEETPEEREYREALAASNKADQDAQGVENEWNNFDLLKEIAKLGLDFIAGDIIKCIENPNFMDCLWAIVGIVPWGKIGKLIKSIPKIAKLIDRFLDLKRRLDKARKARKDAKDRLDRAIEACNGKKDPNSFAPGTPVLMGDGTRRPIERVRIGDTVWATDPEIGRSGPRRVTRLIAGTDRKPMVDLTIDPDGQVGGPTVTITATTNHPFWVPGVRDWIDAGRLVFGDALTTADGGRAMVVGARRYTVERRVHNLTVAGLHTFYVTAGGRDLLVHNDPDKGVCDRLAGERAKISQDVDDALKNGRYEDADGLVDQAQKNADEARELARTNPTQANKDAANRAQREVDALKTKVVNAKIDNVARSADPNRRFEAETARSLGGIVRDFDRSYGRNGSIGQVDIETNRVMIEVNYGDHANKATQIKNRYGDPRVNPTGKPVVVYAPKWTKAQVDEYARQGIKVVRHEGELKDFLRQHGENI